MPSSNNSSNGSSIYGTPSRDRDRERLPFPQSSHPSPAPLKHSSSSTSNSSSSINLHATTASLSTASLATPAAAITLEAVLKQNALAADPKSAALDQVIAERNSMSAQNNQLWKLIEKQRTGYNQILKELERIRGERDSYKAKLQSLTGEKPSRSGDRTNKLSLASSGRPRGDGKSEPVPKAQSGSVSNDDSLMTPRGPQHPTLHASRSHEPLAPPNSSQDFQSNLAYASPRPETPPGPPPASAPSTFDTPPTTRAHSRPSPSPLILPVRNDEPAIPSSAISINIENAPFSRQAQAPSSEYSSPSTTSPNVNPFTHNGGRQQNYPPRKSSLAESFTPASASYSGIDSQPGSASVATPTPHNYMQSQAPTSVSSQKEVESTTHSFADTPNSRHFTPAMNGHQASIVPTRHGSLDLQAPKQSHLLSPAFESQQRDSRITLPDEARRYITNMVDSPAVSPSVNNFSSSGSSAAHTPAADTRSLSSASGSASEFLDLDEDDDNDDENDEKIPQGSSGSSRLGPVEPVTPTNFNFGKPPQSFQTPVESTPSRPRKERIVVDEFPLPPHSASQSQTSLVPDGSSPSQYYSGASPSKQLQTPSDHLASSNSAHQPQDTANSVRGYNNPAKNSPSPHNDMKQPPPPVSASFRALPLLSSDLPHTGIQVSQSFVRPNDRGKEVLSFIVSVNPGHGKQGWKVEKMYSDVISLDQRVRNTVGKGVLKKIGTLPEGKLWKDHAPARVDQRKAVLEQYLQSLIVLPIKNNDEVIAFFTSDIVRETKQPVMQAGHKEGYLTKRGKNFGGWKTRFFVLQGPALEYYDCRGGQHLGSIQITGAQIARQHKTERNSGGDEENEYRHAFLIVEAKKGPGGSHPRHVLCAESDEERDAWVELLVRYYTGNYNEDLVFNASSGINSANSNSIATAAANQQASSPVQSRTSTSSSSDGPLSSTPRKPSSRPPLSFDDYARSSSPSRSVDPSPIERQGPAAAFYEAQMRRAGSERGGLPSSLPDASPLSSVPPIQSDSSVERAVSEQGHYPDLQGPGSARPRQHSPERHRTRDVYEGAGRHANYSTSNLQNADRAPSPEKPDMSRVKISGPMNGTPIPQGFKFGKEVEPISSSERREKAKSRSFWNFGKNAGGDKHPSIVPRAVFAIPLDDSLDVAQICGLPAIVFRCIQYLEAKKADQEEGIYRLSGSSAVIKSLKDRFNIEGDLDLLASDEYWDPHAIAGLLKNFLRDLPSSILTREMHLRFLAVIDLMDAQERIKELSQLIAALPIANYTLLRALTAHLILIVQNSHVNKMTMRNVGIVFSPTLGIPAGVFSLMLAEFNRVFNVDSDEDSIIQVDDPAKLSEPMRRNSKRYSDSAADKLLGLSGRTLKASEEESSQADEDEYSVHDESGTEGTVDSASSSPTQELDPSSPSVRVSPPDTPMASKTSKASSTAASRGLNVSVSHSERGNRHSKLIGLPTSPRPQTSPSRVNET
ncbi:RhoGAP-domain-containing protein [Coprinopsis marcescibilis]|uniref:RhoGAP-domain-containing protein n=1 Tax=Coprinopsis marcescibilis TaxID=230819 RepID=A0A5C3KFI0_COPMA|nr:RhoGAP-domain-containing protein [Coprinopsis marcescibilis]